MKRSHTHGKNKKVHVAKMQDNTSIMFKDFSLAHYTQ